MCEYPWSNRDLFQYVNDCHIYIPIFTFSMSLNIICAALTIVYALQEFFKRKRKDIPLVCVFIEIFFFVFSIPLVFRSRYNIRKSKLCTKSPLWDIQRRLLFSSKFIYIEAYRGIIGDG